MLCVQVSMRGSWHLAEVIAAGVVQHRRTQPPVVHLHASRCLQAAEDDVCERDGEQIPEPSAQSASVGAGAIRLVARGWVQVSTAKPALGLSMPRPNHSRWSWGSAWR